MRRIMFHETSPIITRIAAATMMSTVSASRCVARAAANASASRLRSGLVALDRSPRNATCARCIVSICSVSCAIGVPWMIDAATPRAVV